MRLAIVFLSGVAGLSCRAPEARDSMQDGSVRPASGDSGAGTFDLQDVLNEQADAWNRGDIEGFMDYYWRSEDLEFISGDTILRGWQATLERYKRKYPTKEAMGWLDFDDLRVCREHTVTASVVNKQDRFPALIGIDSDLGHRCGHAA